MPSMLPEIQLGLIDGVVLWAIIAALLVGLLLLTTAPGILLWVLIVAIVGLVVWALLRRIARWFSGGRQTRGTGGRGGGE